MLRPLHSVHIVGARITLTGGINLSPLLLTDASASLRVLQAGSVKLTHDLKEITHWGLNAVAKLLNRGELEEPRFAFLAASVITVASLRQTAHSIDHLGVAIVDIYAATNLLDGRSRSTIGALAQNADEVARGRV